VVGGVFSTISSLDSLFKFFLTASFLATGELVAELLEESGVFTLFLFLVLCLGSGSLGVFLLALALGGFPVSALSFLVGDVEVEVLTGVFDLLEDDVEAASSNFLPVL